MDAAFRRHGNAARIGVVTQGADIMATFSAKRSTGNA
jgi:hypothetical protein